MYQRPPGTRTATVTNGDQPSVPECAVVDPTAWELLERLGDAADAVEAIAYNMRVITHLAAISDHRHLQAFANDLTAATEHHVPADRALRDAAHEAASAWGLPTASPLSQVVAAAPDGVRDALGRKLNELQSVTRELQQDGAVVSELLESALRVVSKRCRDAEQRPVTDPTYRPLVAVRGRAAGS
jgi:hypothetical protein